MSRPAVSVAGLTKVFRTYRREEGLAAALKSLVKRHAVETAAVSDVTFSIEPGEMVGYIGANGAGKSTTIKMLTGILTPTSGEILCNGFVPASERTRYVATIGVVFGQRTQLWWDIAVVESFKLLKEIYGFERRRVRAPGWSSSTRCSASRPTSISPCASSRSASGCAAISRPPCSTARRSSSSTSPRSAWTSWPRRACGSSCRRSTGGKGRRCS